MMWSPRSAHTSPIEHLWDTIERSVRAQNTAPETLSQLGTAAETAWFSISTRDFPRLVEFMPRQVTALRRAKGGSTRY